MNPLTNVKNIQKLSEQELKRNFKTSWHDQYKDSAWVFIGGLPYDLTEGDVICVFSQYGEVVNLNLVRDKSTGKSKGFCFLCYEDQRSTILAVDNFNGMKVLGRVIRVDHVNDYKPPKESKNIDDVTKTLYETGCAPGSSILSISSNKSSQEELDTKDGIKNIKKEKKKKSKKEKSKRSAKKKSRKKKKKRKKEESSSSSSSSESSEASGSSSDDESGEEDGGAVKDTNQGKESKKTGDCRDLRDGKVLEETVKVKVEEEEEEKRRRRRREERTKDSRWRGEDGEWTRKENCASEASDGMVMRRGLESERGGGSRGEHSGERRGEDRGELGTSRGRDDWWECNRRKRVEEERRHENGENGVERRHGRIERGRGEAEWGGRGEAEWGGRGEAEWGGRREKGCVDDRSKKDRFEREARGVEEGSSRKGGECPDRFESDYNDRKEEMRKKRDKRSMSPQERNYGKSKRSR